MNIHADKAQRLEQVARLYYEQNKTQDEIAKQMGVSRPLISRMLNEARRMGIVEIQIHTPAESGNFVLNQAKNVFGLKGGVLLPEAADDHILNRSLAQAAIKYIHDLGGGRLGIGWGHIIGTLVEIFEQQSPERNGITDICPMVGNSGISIRNYHSNENVRIIAHHTMATAHYLHTPAFAETRQDMDLLLQTEHYKSVYKEWERLDVALVNIGNYPSTPDLASVARYGNLLSQCRAVGRLIAYFFNERGEIIQSDSDYAIQIPIPLLTNCRNVIGICSANVDRRAIAGALRTGLLTHIIARENLIYEVLKSN